MTRDKGKSDFASEGDLAADETGSVTGSEGNDAVTPAADDIAMPIGAEARSETTGRHDEGSDANDTIDGLTESEEMVRRNAEDIPSGRTKNLETTPVFDRADQLPDV